MKFTTLIPMRYNDGRELPPEEMDRIIDGLAEQFDGCSGEAITKGQWLDPKAARLYREADEFPLFAGMISCGKPTRR